MASLPDVIQWFLDYDQRVAIIKHPRVEEIFQWKQQASRSENEDVYLFNNAEDRLAVGIVQAMMEHPSERDLHTWIGQLLNALEEAAQTNEAIAGAHAIDLSNAKSVTSEAAKIPASEERTIFLTCCWLETLCTAEVRVLGWLYQELYGRSFQPDNF